MSAKLEILIESLKHWFAGLIGGAGESAGTDRDFDGWVANDPMVTMNPASRYGDDANGFLAGPDSENPTLGGD